ncbi:MAG: hypothetical protein M3Y18_08730 [Candidatus Eremiobacteraeota bacterium]|nr:hypothetical protein [Candidatus Eremiobacteraeota bacterium]
MNIFSSPTRLRAFAFVLVGLTLLAGLQRHAAVGAAPAKHPAAPADRYFGRLKLSYLGINNTFRDAAITAGSYTTDKNLIHKLQFADAALHDWMKEYPNDPHLPRSFYLASETYKKIWTKEYQDKAWAYMQLLKTKYPTTFFGKQVKKDVAGGFTQRYFAQAQPCGAAPQPALIVQQRAGQPKVQIEIPPCIQSDIPSPEPSATTEIPTTQPSPSASPTGGLH